MIPKDNNQIGIQIYYSTFNNFHDNKDTLQKYLNEYYKTYSICNLK